MWAVWSVKVGGIREWVWAKLVSGMGGSEMGHWWRGREENDGGAGGRGWVFLLQWGEVIALNGVPYGGV